MNNVNQPSCCQYRLSSGYLPNIADHKICEDAAANGHIECIKYAHKIKKHNMYVNTLWNAINNGNLDIVKYFINHNKIIPDYTLAHLAKIGNLDMLKFLYTYSKEHPCCGWDHQWEPWLCYNASMYEHLDVLKWLHEGDGESNFKPCPWNSDVCINAAIFGRLDILDYAYKCGFEKPPSDGCKLIPHLYKHAIDRNHQHIIRYLKENGCPISSHSRI